MHDYFPPLEHLMEMQPEEVGKYLLIYLKHSVETNQGRNKVHISHLINPSAPDFQSYAGNNNNEPAMRILAEAWGWLEIEGYLAPDPQNSDNSWRFITRKGMEVNSVEDFKTFSNARLLPRDALDPILVSNAYGLFARGEYEKAVFEAYKAVEVKVREASKLLATDIGVSLARKAFDPKTGPLTDQTSDDGEKQAYSALFAGVLGTFKNPSSHRYVNYNSPSTAAGLILFANSLIQIVSSRSQKTNETA